MGNLLLGCSFYFEIWFGRCVWSGSSFAKQNSSVEPLISFDSRDVEAEPIASWMRVYEMDRMVRILHSEEKPV